MSHLTIIKDRFSKEGLSYTEGSIDGKKVLIAYNKQFRWSWMATQLNTFIIVGEHKGEISKREIENFSTACYNYAIKNHKGWPRGLQSGVGSLAVLIGDGLDSEARQFCEKPSKKHWSAFEIPLIYDNSTEQLIYYTRRPAWGAIYFGFFNELIKKNLTK